MESLIILANLGRVRVLRYQKAGDIPQEKPHLVEAPDSTSELRPESVHEVVTDQAGRFTQSGELGRLGGMSCGEEHDLEAELEKKALHRIADRIGAVVADAGFPGWRLAAPSEILPALLEALPGEARKGLARSEPGDFTRASLADLETRFLKA